MVNSVITLSLLFPVELIFHYTPHSPYHVLSTFNITKIIITVDSLSAPKPNYGQIILSFMIVLICTIALSLSFTIQFIFRYRSCPSWLSWYTKSQNMNEWNYTHICLTCTNKKNEWVKLSTRVLWTTVFSRCTTSMLKLLQNSETLKWFSLFGFYAPYIANTSKNKQAENPELVPFTVSMHWWFISTNQQNQCTLSPKCDLKDMRQCG